MISEIQNIFSSKYYFSITFFSDLTYIIYFLFDKQAFDKLLKVINIQNKIYTINFVSAKKYDNYRYRSRGGNLLSQND